MSSKSLNCLVRKTSVSSTPEEIVRQSLLHYLVDNLGYPLESIAVEKGLDQMPHISLSSHLIPQRRADIICFAKGIHPKFTLYPLLLIECKSVKLDGKVKNQVIGYNRFLRSYYIAIVNQSTMQTGWFDQSSGEYHFVDGILDYHQLLSSINY